MHHQFKSKLSVGYKRKHHTNNRYQKWSMNELNLAVYVAVNFILE